MHKKVKVKITKKEMEYVVDLAKQRNQKEKRFGGKTYNDTMTAGNSHLIGLIGEFIAAKYLGVKVDDRIFANKGDDGIDLVHPIHGNIAVKTSTYEDAWLRAEEKRNFDYLDMYILCYVSKDLKDTYLVGYISRDKLHELCPVPKKLGRYLPPNRIAKSEDLADPRELLA